MRLVYGDTISSTSLSFRPFCLSSCSSFATRSLASAGSRLKPNHPVAVFGDAAQRGIALAAENDRHVAALRRLWDSCPHCRSSRTRHDDSRCRRSIACASRRYIRGCAARAARTAPQSPRTPRRTIRCRRRARSVLSPVVSRLAITFASTNGLCSGTRQIPVARRTLLVTAAAKLKRDERIEPVGIGGERKFAAVGVRIFRIMAIEQHHVLGRPQRRKALAFTGFRHLADDVRLRGRADTHREQSDVHTHRRFFIQSDHCGFTNFNMKRSVSPRFLKTFHVRSSSG